jgi:hypothetical protein
MNIDNWSQASTLFIHYCEVRFATRDSQGDLVPDFSRPRIGFSGLQERGTAFAAGNYLYRQGSYHLDNHFQFDPWKEEGIAFILYAPPGQTPSSPNVQRALRSAGERYGNSPQASFSGVRDGKTGALHLLVPPVVPEASEFMFAVGFHEAMVSVSATSSGDTSEPWAMHTGVGAYYNDLASKGGRLRLYVEEDSVSIGAPPGKSRTYAFPLLSLGRGTVRYRLSGLLCDMVIHPLDPVATTPLLWGWYSNFEVRDAYTNFADAFAWTTWITVPQSPALIGLKLHFEVASASFWTSIPQFIAVTNSLEITLQ